jgi:hypothetical protein
MAAQQIGTAYIGFCDQNGRHVCAACVATIEVWHYSVLLVCFGLMIPEWKHPLKSYKPLRNTIFGRFTAERSLTLKEAGHRMPNSSSYRKCSSDAIS